jgi:hypothetical protein
VREGSRQALTRALLRALVGVAITVFLVDSAIAVLLAFPPRTGPLLSVARVFYANVDRDIIQLNPAAARWDPELFYTLRPGRFVFAQREFQHEYRVNRLGLRDEEAALAGPAVIAVGDSFTMGWGVAQKETYPTLVEAATGMRTLNAGVASYGTVREMLMLNRLDTSHLRYLIVQYNADDFGENEAFRRQGNRHIPRDEARWRAAVRDLAAKRRYLPGKYTWEALRRLFPNLLHGPRSARAATADDETSAFLNALVHAPRVDLRRVEILVWAPTGREFLVALRDAVARLETHHVTVVDVPSALRPERDFWLLDDHLNASGHRIVADRLVAAIRALGATR